MKSFRSTDSRTIGENVPFRIIWTHQIVLFITILQLKNADLGMEKKLIYNMNWAP